MLLLESLILNEHYEKKEKRLLVGGGEPPEKVHEEPKAGILSLEIGNIVHAGPKSHITQYVLSLIIYIYIYIFFIRERPTESRTGNSSGSIRTDSCISTHFLLFIFLKRENSPALERERYTLAFTAADF